MPCNVHWYMRYEKIYSIVRQDVHLKWFHIGGQPGYQISIMQKGKIGAFAGFHSNNKYFS